MQIDDFDLEDPDFLDRARDVREDIEAGKPMTLEEISDRLGMPFDLFARFLAGEMFRVDPSIVAVVVGEPEAGTVH